MIPNRRYWEEPYADTYHESENIMEKNFGKFSEIKKFPALQILLQELSLLLWKIRQKTCGKKNKKIPPKKLAKIQVDSD